MKASKQSKEIKIKSSISGKAPQTRTVKKTNYVYKVYSTQEHSSNVYYPPSSYNRQEISSRNSNQNQSTTQKKSNRISKITTYVLSDYTTPENLEKIILIQKWWRDLYLTKYTDNDYVNQINYINNQNKMSGNEYIIETKKVELYKKMGDNQLCKCSDLSIKELLFHMKNLWNDENTISTTGSLFVPADENSKNEIIYSYEEEIRNLKQALMAKEEELCT